MNEKGVGKGIWWYVKTRLLGLLMIAIWFVLVILSFFIYGKLTRSDNGYIPLITGTAIAAVIVYLIIRSNKIEELKPTKKLSKNRKKARGISTIFMIVLGLLILIAVILPTAGKEMPNIVWTIFEIVLACLMLLYIYFRFVKKG